MKQYKGRFLSLDNNEYEVVFSLLNTTSNEIETLLFTENPIITSMEGDDDIYKPIKYDNAVISIVTNKVLDDLSPLKYGDIKVELKNITANSLEWVGFVKPQVYNQDLTYEYNMMEIQCCGCLELLKYKDFTDINKIKYFLEIIFDCVKEANIPGNVYIHNNIVESYGDIIYDDKGYYIAEKLKVNGLNFFDGDPNDEENGDYLKCDEVLESILKYLNLVALMHKGDLYLIDYNQMKGEYAVGGTNAVSGFYRYVTWEDYFYEFLPSGSTNKKNSDILSEVEFSKTKIYNKIKLVGKRNEYSIDFDLLDDDLFEEVDKNDFNGYVSQFAENNMIFYKNNPGPRTAAMMTWLNKFYKPRSQAIKLFNYKLTPEKTISGFGMHPVTTLIPDDDPWINTIDGWDPTYKYSGEYYRLSTGIISDVTFFNEKKSTLENMFKKAPNGQDYFANNNYAKYPPVLLRPDLLEFRNDTFRLNYNEVTYFDPNFRFVPKLSSKRLVVSVPEFEYQYKTSLNGRKAGVMQCPVITPDWQPTSILNFKIKVGYIPKDTTLQIKLKGWHECIPYNHDYWNLLSFYQGDKIARTDSPWLYSSVKYEFNRNSFAFDRIYSGQKIVPMSNNIFKLINVDSYNKMFTEHSIEQQMTVKLGDKYISDGGQEFDDEYKINIPFKDQTEETSNSFEIEVLQGCFSYKNTIDQNIFSIPIPAGEISNAELSVNLLAPLPKRKVNNEHYNDRYYDLISVIYGGHVFYDEAKISLVSKNQGETKLEDIEYENIIDENISNEFNEIENIVTTCPDNVYDKSTVLKKDDTFASDYFWKYDKQKVESGSTNISALNSEEQTIRKYYEYYSKPKDIITLSFNYLLDESKIQKIKHNKIDANKFYLVSSYEKNWRLAQTDAKLYEI